MQVTGYGGGLPHFVSHLAPIWQELPPELQDGFYARGRAAERARELGIEVVANSPRRKELVLVASYEDHRAARSRTILVNHGVGMRYKDESGEWLPHPSYSGGSGRENVVLFLCPSQRDAEVCREGGTPAVAMGPPAYLDPYLRGGRVTEHDSRVDGRPVVALSWHADVHVVPETRWAFPHYRDVITDLAKRQDDLPFRLLGHCHPRFFAHMFGIYRRLGIRFEQDWLKVMDEADLYVCDNSSTMYEFAAIGRPVLTLSAPYYRRDVHHGGRYWSHIPGLHVEEPEDLYNGILAALSDPPEAQRARRAAVEWAYEDLADGNSTNRAVTAITELVSAHA